MQTAIMWRSKYVCSLTRLDGLDIARKVLISLVILLAPDDAALLLRLVSIVSMKQWMTCG